jgi:hypothetical protein
MQGQAMQTDETATKELERRPHTTALQARVAYETAHPEIAITTPLTSCSQLWEVSTADGTTTFGGVWAMLDFLAALFGAADED